MDHLDEKLLQEVKQRLQSQMDVQSQRNALVTDKFVTELCQFMSEQFRQNKQYLSMPQHCGRHTGMMSPK